MKKARKSEPKPALNPEQEKEQVTDEVIDVLLANIRERNDPRSIELLGKLRRFDLFTRPSEAQQPHQFDERTIQILLSLPDDDKCPNCGFDLAPKHSPSCGSLDCTQRRLGQQLKDAKVTPEHERSI